MNLKEHILVENKNLNFKITQHDSDSNDDLIPYDLTNGVKEPNKTIKSSTILNLTKIDHFVSYLVIVD